MLPRPWRFNLRLALAAMGFGEEEAHRLSRASARSLTLVVRRIAVGGTIPAWAVAVTGTERRRADWRMERQVKG